MFIEQLTASNFRCFGPVSQSIQLGPGLAAFVGSNGTGKTAAMLALARMFGVTADQRRVRRQDFHIPVDEAAPLAERTLFIEVLLAFPELDDANADDSAVPMFFPQMASDDAGRLKVRLRLDATWTDDGSPDGAVEQKIRAVRRIGLYEEEDCIDLRATDRARIQMIYVPALRDAASQITTFLRGRLWRAINWSQQVRESLAEAGNGLSTAFEAEAAVDAIGGLVRARWQEVHTGGTDSLPVFRPIDLRFEHFIRKIEVVFRPDETGRDRGIEDLSDGQRSLFHLAMTAAALDIEQRIATNPVASGFRPEGVALPALTLIAVEEPENNLSPFYLSRIVRQLLDLTGTRRAQAVVSSHSPSILARVEPSDVRHFRLVRGSRTCQVRGIRLPAATEDAARFVREAVRSYPELYFAKFVILGEGASEEVVLPRIAEALNFPIDRSFVAVVPLGGRHVNHLWRLLNDLEIPYATLLDLDWGRSGGGWGRIRDACAQLIASGSAPEALLGAGAQPDSVANLLAALGSQPAGDTQGMQRWITALRNYHIYFCMPLDLDYSMLNALPAQYRLLEAGQQGPSVRGDPRTAVLGEEGEHALYPDADEPMRWYRYLFLGRGKPSTHVRVLSAVADTALATSAPEELRALLQSVVARLGL